MTYDIGAGDLPPGATVKCGNRADLPKKERRHAWQELGPEVRHSGDGTFIDGTVRACGTCGADQFSKTKKAPPGNP